MQEETKPSVNRRGLLRRAGTVAAGVGAAGVAGAVVASPALADDGGNVVIGGNNTGTAKTSLTAGNANTPTLKLSNTVANGLPLELRPIDYVGGFSPVTQDQINTLPAGSTYADNFGDLHIVSRVTVGGQQFSYDNMLYSPTWAMMPFPVPPRRIISTYSGHAAWGRDLVLPGSANYDAIGRVIPKNTSGPDLVIDLSDLLAGSPAALQGNLTVGDPTGTGYISLWTSGPFPDISSLNFTRGVWTENFTQTLVGDDLRIRVKVTAPTIVAFDISGWILADPLSQLIYDPFGPAAGARAAEPPRRGLTPRRAGL